MGQKRLNKNAGTGRDRIDETEAMTQGLLDRNAGTETQEQERRNRNAIGMV